MSSESHVYQLFDYEYPTSSIFISSSVLRNKLMANCNEMPVKIPNFCLCGTVGIHTHTSIKKPTKNPKRNPHRKSRSVPTVVLNICGSGHRRRVVFWFKLSLNSDAGPWACIQASSCKSLLRRASSSSAWSVGLAIRYRSTCLEK